jgi:alkanesulfonate monooxygenase SsuD/methylene tetrahydromethanopterin reductase-like flavin-dependent oxidoreductase (luciferase family)
MIKFGLSLPLSYDINRLINLTSQAENVGFDYAFMPDHIISLDGSKPLNIWSVLNILAVSTHKIGLGSMVANVYRQHPSTLRQQVYTLKQTIQMYSKMRREIMVGLGAGLRFDCEPFGISQIHPLTRMKDSCRQLQDLDVNVVMGAYGPKMKELASKYGGWVSRHALSPTEFGNERDEVEQHLRDDDKDYLYIADVPVSHLDEPWLWKTLAYRYLLQTKYREETFNQLVKDDIEIDSSTVPHPILEGFSAVGSTDEIIDKLESYVSYGAKMFSIRYYGDSLEKLSGVMEYFRNQ